MLPVKATLILILNVRLVFCPFAVFFRAEGINYMFSISNMFTAGYWLADCGAIRARYVGRQTNRQRAIYEYPNMVPRLSGIILMFSKFSAPTIAFLAFWLAKKLRLWANAGSWNNCYIVVFTLCPSLLWELRNRRNWKKKIVWKPRGHIRILLYRAWPIGPCSHFMHILVSKHFTTGVFLISPPFWMGCKIKRLTIRLLTLLIGDCRDYSCSVFFIPSLTAQKIIIQFILQSTSSILRCNFVFPTFGYSTLSYALAILTSWLSYHNNNLKNIFMNHSTKFSFITRERGVWHEKARSQNCRGHKRPTRVLAVASVNRL